jgi:hypothetical protein
MVKNINALYDALVTMVKTEMNVAMCKTDIRDFEIHPAIGFGLAITNDSDLISGASAVELNIPVAIEDYGAGHMVNMSVMTMYEDFKKLVNSKLPTYLDANHVNWSNPKLGQFNENLAITDPATKGLIGTINIIIKL